VDNYARFKYLFKAHLIDAAVIFLFCFQVSFINKFSYLFAYLLNSINSFRKQLKTFLFSGGCRA